MRINELARFAAMVIRRGKFHSSGVNFSERRKAFLADLKPFCPTDPDGQQHSRNQPRFRLPWFNFWVGQAANPFARLVSFYRHFFEQPQEAFIYEDYLFGVFRKNQTFKEFVRTLNNIPAALLDQHIKPQHRLLQPYREKNIKVQIFKLEEPTAFLEFLSRHSLHLETINAGVHSEDYRNYYDAETLEIASKLYAGDLAMFRFDHF